MSKGPHAVRLLELAERGRAASPVHAPKPPAVARLAVCPGCECAAVDECMCRPRCSPTCAITCMHCDRRFRKYPSGYVEEG